MPPAAQRMRHTAADENTLCVPAWPSLGFGCGLCWRNDHAHDSTLEGGLGLDNGGILQVIHEALQEGQCWVVTSNEMQLEQMLVALDVKPNTSSPDAT